MATNSDRNLSFEQAQAMWPGTNVPIQFTNTSASVVGVPYPTATKYDNTVDGATVVMTPELRNRINNITDGIIAPTKQAVKADEGKPDWSLVPFESLEGMVKVLEFGAKKYSAWNWTEGGGFKWMRVFASTMRHMFAWVRGQDLDPESGLSHIYHAQCNLLFLAHYVGNKEKFNKDDRNVR